MTRSRTPKSFPRSRRVAQQLQRTLSELIRREIRDPRLGLVTLTEVRMSSDLSYATIYYSVLNAQRSEAQEVLSSAAEILRGPVGRALGLRHAPELRFIADELIESGARLSALIQKAVKDDVARHVASDDEAPAADRQPDADPDADEPDADRPDADR
jgi:ribosome-binding factor A